MPSSNPLLARNEIPDFAAIRPEQVLPALEQALADAAEVVSAIEDAPPSFAQVLRLEAMRQAVTQSFSPVTHLNAVKSTPELRDAYNAALPRISRFFTELGQNRKLLGLYEAVADTDEVKSDPIKLQLVNQTLRDFRLAGVGLEADARERFLAASEKLTQAQAKFEQNLMDATDAFEWHTTDRSALGGLPEAIVAAAEARAREDNQEGFLLRLDPPTYMAVMGHAHNRALRETYYRAWVTRAADIGTTTKWDNSPVMQEILSLRSELAQLLGYGNYAEVSLATKMAEAPGEVLRFLRGLAEKSRAAATKELEDLEKFAGRKLRAWDLGYYAERLKNDRFGIDEEALRPYFPVERVLDGLFRVANTLFGITFETATPVSTWHEDVKYYSILDAKGLPVGGLFLDLYARPNKRGGAWMDECLTRHEAEEGTIRPVAHIVCNFASPNEAGKAFLTHRDVTTLFHECGHALHHLLTEVDYPSIAGINGVPWDAVELPSMFFENYAWQPEVLSWVSQHRDSGEALPAEICDRLKASRKFHAGLQMLRQIEFSLFDFELHAQNNPATEHMIALLDDVRREVALVPVPDYNRFAHSFAHVFGGGYAAGYYSYKWSELLAADAFSAFGDDGLDPDTAARFRNEILAVGGSRDMAEAFRAFRGRPPELTPLLVQEGLAA